MFVSEFTNWFLQACGGLQTDQDSPFPILHSEKGNLSVCLVELRAWDSSGLPDTYWKEMLSKEQHANMVVLWEDQWHRSEPVVKHRLLAFTGHSRRIHGRQCKVTVTDRKTVKSFLDKNHLLGFTGYKKAYCLIFKEEIVSVATFGRSVGVERDGNRVESHELVRFCHKNGYHVTGGLSKLLTHFVRQEAPEDIYTVVDREWSRGRGYIEVGFRIIGETPPIPFWVDDNFYRHRNEIATGCRIINAGNIKLALAP